VPARVVPSGPGKDENTVAVDGEIPNACASERQLVKPGIGRRIPKDTIDGNRQHGGAPAAE
jgi:hypothetical protein